MDAETETDILTQGDKTSRAVRLSISLWKKCSRPNAHYYVAEQL